MLGRPDEARTILRVLVADAEARPSLVLPDLALIHLGLGELDETLRLLEAAAELRAGAVVFLGVEPTWSEGLRRDERFERFLMRIDHPLAPSA